MAYLMSSTCRLYWDVLEGLAGMSETEVYTAKLTWYEDYGYLVNFSNL